MFGMHEGYLWGPIKIHIGSCTVYVCNVSMLMTSIVFADDTTLFYSGDNLSQFVKLHQLNWANYIHLWFQVKKLSLNNFGKNIFFDFW